MCASCEPKHEGDWVEPTRTNMGTIGSVLAKIGHNIEQAADSEETDDLQAIVYILEQLSLAAEVCDVNGPQIARMLLLNLAE